MNDVRELERAPDSGADIACGSGQVMAGLKSLRRQPVTALTIFDEFSRGRRISSTSRLTFAKAGSG